VVRDFIDSERAHIAMEEQIFFPAALKTLLPTDWAQIEATLSERAPSPLKSAAGRPFRALQERIVAWETENEAARLNGV
jgi:hypothetical protein